MPRCRHRTQRKDPLPTRAQTVSPSPAEDLARILSVPLRVAASWCLPGRWIAARWHHLGRDEAGEAADDVSHLLPSQQEGKGAEERVERSAGGRRKGHRRRAGENPKENHAVEAGNGDMPAVSGRRRGQDEPVAKNAGWTHWDRVCKYADGERVVEDRILAGGMAKGELGYVRKLQPSGTETEALNAQDINAGDGRNDGERNASMVHAESNEELFEMDESIVPGGLETPTTHHLHHTLPFWKFGWPGAQAEQTQEETTMNFSENRLLDIMRPGSAFEEDLAIQVKMMRNRIGSPETVQLSSEAVAAQLRKEGYNARVVAKKATEGDYLRTWSHSYVIVHRGSGEEIIVEPNFAAQFQVARPTQTFKKIVDMIPLEFVGSMERLLQVADFLATKALESLRASGLNVPPWRERDGMLSKWMPNDNFNSVRPCGKVF